ncbi:MAG: PEP-CTERM sorting domain-containing protein [Opitutaceae bacterium]|jgi:hypothetical protein
MKTTLILSALVGLCAVIPASMHAQSVLIDFSSANSITDNLNKGTIVNVSNGNIVAGSMGNLTYSASTGLGGGGGGQNPAATNDIFMYGTKQAFASTFTTATTSTYVQIKAGSNSGAGLALTMGFTNLATPESGNGGTTGSPTSIPRPTTFSSVTQNSIAVVLRETTGAPDTWNFGAYNNGSATGITNSGSISLTVGNWYFWETTYTNDGGGSLTFTANLYASDTSGVYDSGASLLTYQKTVSNTALLSADLYGFIGSQNGDRRGIAQLDNLSFSAVPEPSSYAAIFGLLSLVGALTLRRSRRN